MKCIHAGLLAAFAAYVPLAFAGRPTERHNGRDVAAKEIILKLKREDPAALHAAAVDAGSSEISPLSHTARVFLLRSRSKNVAAMLAAMERHAGIEYAEPNYIIQANVTPNDPSFQSLWGLNNSGQVILGAAGTARADIRASSAWQISTGSTVNVAGVLDTGIDYTHPDLAANMWSAPAAFTVSIGGTSLTCPAGSHGYNAVSHSCNPADDHGHGTHVAGTIGAAGNNAAGVTGVNWTTRIMALKVLGADGVGSTADAVKAIDFAIQVKARFGGAAPVRVLSASWGGPDRSQALADAIALAGANDMLFAAAAGNSSNNNDLTPEYPAALQLANLVAVTATDNNDQLAGFANWGPASVHLGAPGVSILSTMRGGGYGWMSGTSMATPHVSGAAMLVLSKCPLNTAALRAALLTSVDPVTPLAGRTKTGGRLNVDRALRSCATVAPPVSAFSPVRINAGGGAVTDAAGNTWAADPNLPGYAYNSGQPIGNTADSRLYQSQRWSTTAMAYQIAVPAGSYSVTLKFAEMIYYPGPGMRKFSIALNGQTVEPAFDVAAAAGGWLRAVDRRYTVNAPNGQIAIHLGPVLNGPILNAIEVTSAAAAVPSFTPIRMNSGGLRVSDSTGQVWAADTNSAGYAYNSGQVIANTPDSMVYQSQRWSTSPIRYQFAVPSGNYRLTLKFAEMISYPGPGMRKFDIIVNGQTVEAGFDPAAAAGGWLRATDRQYTVAAVNGQIVLDLVPVLKGPIINGIEITAGP